MARLLTLLEIVSQAAMEIGIAQQAVQSVVQSQDQDIVQMRALLYSVADEVLAEEPYVATLGDQNWIADVDGVPQEYFEKDNDVVMFDGRLAINGVKWRFLAAKSLEFGEAMRDFTTRMAKLAARSNARVLDLDAEDSRVQ